MQKPKASSSAKEAAPGAAGGERRLIKKYPNRRLYDTDSSSYVTLAEIKQLVMSAEPFAVLDAKTNDDLTRSILLQIILEEESGGVPMFSEAVLTNIIRFYGHAMQSFMGSYLESNVQAFSDMQSKLGQQAKGLTPEMWTQMLSMPAPMLGGVGKATTAPNAWVQMQEQMQKQMQAQTEQMLAVFGVKR